MALQTARLVTALLGAVVVVAVFSTGARGAGQGWSVSRPDGITEGGVHVRVDPSGRTVFVAWSNVEHAARVEAFGSTQPLDSYDIGLWLRQPVGPFGAMPSASEPHVRLHPGRDGVDAGLMLRNVQKHLEGGAPGALTVRAEVHYMPHGGSDLFELHLYRRAPGVVSRFRTFENEPSHEVQRDLSPEESQRIQQRLEERNAFSLASVDDPYPDGLRGQIVLRQGTRRHTIDLHSVADDNPARALLTFLLELAPLPTGPPTASSTRLPSRS